MAKKKIDDNDTDVVDHRTIVEKYSKQEFGRVMDDNFTQYGLMVIGGRALPDARDGLKPSQRRVLVAMNDLKLRPTEHYQKNALICGHTSGHYHPHGESVVYPTLVRMAAPFDSRYPLVAFQGNYGSRNGAPAAAMRYTESRMSKIGYLMLGGGESLKTLVPFVPTYNEQGDGEPLVLPAAVPNLLINGAEGIAAGVACRLAPHNLREVIEAVKARILHPNLTVDDLMKIVPGPDFPTPCKILGQEGVRSYMETGRGTVRMEGEYEIVQDKHGKHEIKITGLPYGGNVEQFLTEVKQLGMDRKIDGIAALDGSDTEKKGIDINIEIVKGHNPQVILNKLLSSTCLRTSYSVNTTVLIDGVKMEENVPFIKLLDVFIAHRKFVFTNMYNHELAEKRARLHIVEGLLGITSKIDAVIKLIRACDTRAEASEQLILKKFVSSAEQAKAVLDITLGKLTKLDIVALENERDALMERIDWLIEVLASDKLLLREIVKEQDLISKKFGDDRRCEIGFSADDLSVEDLIKEEPIIIHLTADGYLKRTPVAEYSVQNRGGKGVTNVSKKTEDAGTIFVASTHDLILFFTNRGRMLKKKGYQVPEATRTNKGQHLANILQLQADEEVVTTIPLRTLDQDGYILMVTRGGLIKRTELRDYISNRKESGLNAIKLVEGDCVAFVDVTDGSQDVFLATSKGKAVRYSEDNVSVTGRSTQGVRALRLTNNDSIAQMLTIDPKQNPDILVVTSQGYGKRTNASEYRSMSGRNVQGVATINQKTDRNGDIVCAEAIAINDTLIILTNKGKIIQMPVKQIKTQGRSTMGVRVVDLDIGDEVASIAKVENGMAAAE